jgi:hypothetical protein
VFRDLFYVDKRPLRLGVHFPVKWSEDVIDAAGCAERDVILQHAGIEVVIGGLIELQCVDEDTGDDHRTASPRLVE